MSGPTCNDECGEDQQCIDDNGAASCACKPGFAEDGDSCTPFVVRVVAYSARACALVGSSVLCWGDGEDGALGYGDEENVGDDETPASVGDLGLPGDV